MSLSEFLFHADSVIEYENTGSGVVIVHGENNFLTDFGTWNNDNVYSVVKLSKSRWIIYQ